MIFEALRRMIRRSGLLYPLAQRIKGTYTDEEIPSDQTELVVTGYHRSANTFSLKLLQQLKPGIRIASHAHAVATLKIARKKGVKTIVLVRNPLDAVSSNVVRSQPSNAKQQIKNARRLLADYIDYYRYVKDHQDRCRILHFETVTKTPERLVEEVVRLGVMEPKDAETVRSAAGSVVGELRAKDLPPDRLNIGGPDREAKKKAVKQILLENPRFNRRLKLAEALYQAVSAHSPAAPSA